MSKMRQPKYGTLSAVPTALYGADLRTYGSVRGCCRRPGCTCGRRQDIDDAAVYYHVLGASSLGAASLGRASLGRGHSPRRRSAAQAVKQTSNGTSSDADLPINDQLLRKLSRNKDRFSSVSSRRSILECDVTAYDLIKKYLRTPAAPDSDDDDLNCNVVLNGAKKGKKNIPVAPSRGSRPPVTLGLWPEEPDPDYDEDSDVGLEVGRFKDLKISYSPPLVRKGSTAAAKARNSAAAATRRAHSCSPARPTTTAKSTTSQSVHVRGILKNTIQKKKKPMGTQRGKSYGPRKKVTFQDAFDPTYQAWDDSWDNVQGPDVNKTRPVVEGAWEPTSQSTHRPGRAATSAYTNGNDATRRHGVGPSSKHLATVEPTQARRLDITRSSAKAETRAEAKPESKQAQKPDLHIDPRYQGNDRKGDANFGHKFEVRPNGRAERGTEGRGDLDVNYGLGDWDLGLDSKPDVPFSDPGNGQGKDLAKPDLRLHTTNNARQSMKAEINDPATDYPEDTETVIKDDQHAETKAFSVTDDTAHNAIQCEPEHKVTASEPVSDSVPNSTIHSKVISDDEYSAEGEPPSGPEPKPDPVYDSKTYQRTGFKVRAETHPDTRLTVCRPLSPPPPVPTYGTTPASKRPQTEGPAENTVMVTSQTSTGTRVLISSHGRLSGSYPVRRTGAAKRRPRMRHSAPQLDGDSARALFAAPAPMAPTSPGGVTIVQRLQPAKESTSTFYVSLTGGTRAPREEKAAQSRPTARSPDEPLYADTLPTVVSAPECAVYDDCSASQEPVYEELPEQPTQQHREKKVLPFDIPQKSFFEGASKADILGYLEDAKVRGLENLVSDLGTVSFEALAEDTALDKLPSSADVERNDSGIGGDRYAGPLEHSTNGNSEEQRCADCDQQVTGDEELVCPKCEKKRTERREIITEIVQTELKYGHDLRIVKEEFYKPIETAGLLTKPQLHEIFLNLDELITVNTSFSEKLQDALDIASEQGDEEYTTVDIGKLFLGAAGMLQAFQTYCVRQANASLSLMAQEKEKELLRIFLRVSQMENTLLRRMNLAAFLMAPVQRVTKYPLLLSRLYKVTPHSHQDREALRDAQLRVQLHLEHINQLTRGTNPTKIWRRISSISVNPRRAPANLGVGSIKLRKMALDLLRWNRDETRFVMAGRLLVAEQQPYGRAARFASLHGLLAVLGRPNSNYRPDLAHDNSLLFPRNTGIRDGALLLAKEKAGKFVLPREPLSLGSCIISCDPELKDCFEIQEHTSKEGFLFKAENSMETREWLKQLRYHAKDLGSWRRRRNGMANIMINGMDRY
ncbi:unnamed protein product [Ixodes persulcatus]